MAECFGFGAENVLRAANGLGVSGRLVSLGVIASFGVVMGQRLAQGRAQEKAAASTVGWLRDARWPGMNG